MVSTTHRALGSLAGAALMAGIFAAAPISALAAGTHKADPNCTISATTVGAPLQVSGSGYQAGKNYEVVVTWPGNNGAAGYAGPADSTGHLYVNTWAGWSGTYVASVYATSGNQAQLATCSATVS